MPSGWDEFEQWNHQPRGRRGNWAKWAAAGVLLYGLGVVSGGYYVNQASVKDNLTPLSQGSSTPPVSATSQTTTASGLITQVYEQVHKSVVTITAVTPASSKSSAQEDLGTGFLIDSNGDIATNAHVVNGQSVVTVTIDGKDYKGTVMGADTIDDLAVVRVSPPPPELPLTFGASDALLPGQQVIAIGNPFQLIGSVSSGIVSGLDRSVPTQTGRVMDGLIQTDAALNPGNSGGPLLNDLGQVIGIDTAIESPVDGSVGIGFAIPISQFQKVLPQLLTGQTISHSWLGISGVSIDPLYQQQFHLKVGHGVEVITTVPGGPAAKAGLRADSGGQNNPVGDGDIITAVDGVPISSIADLTGAIAQHPVGSVIQLTVLRQGKYVTINVTLGNWPGSTK